MVDWKCHRECPGGRRGSENGGTFPHVLENGSSSDVAGSSEQALNLRIAVGPGLHGWGSGEAMEHPDVQQTRRRREDGAWEPAEQASRPADIPGKTAAEDPCPPLPAEAL